MCVACLMEILNWIVAMIFFWYIELCYIVLYSIFLALVYCSVLHCNTFFYIVLFCIVGLWHSYDESSKRLLHSSQYSALAHVC